MCSVSSKDLFLYGYHRHSNSRLWILIWLSIRNHHIRNRLYLTYISLLSILLYKIIWRLCAIWINYSHNYLCSLNCYYSHNCCCNHSYQSYCNCYIHTRSKKEVRIGLKTKECRHYCCRNILKNFPYQGLLLFFCLWYIVFEIKKCVTIFYFIGK